MLCEEWSCCFCGCSSGGGSGSSSVSGGSIGGNKNDQLHILHIPIIIRMLFAAVAFTGMLLSLIQILRP